MICIKCYSVRCMANNVEYKKLPYVVDDGFILVLYSAALDFGADMVREDSLQAIDDVYEFIKWTFEKAGMEPPAQQEFWDNINANYDTASRKLTRTYGR